jgi:hypothetical protein
MIQSQSQLVLHGLHPTAAAWFFWTSGLGREQVKVGLGEKTRKKKGVFFA